MRFKNDESNDDVIEVAPVTAFPSPFPRTCFEIAKSVQKDVNLLMHKVAYDHDFLTTTLQSTIKVDDFTRNLFDIYMRAHSSGSAQVASFGLFRADYMCDKVEDDFRVKQVEVNAIASSFVGLSSKVSDLHRYTISKYSSADKAKANVPVNNADKNYASAFVRAWNIYDNPSSVILVVKEERTINICDQRSLEFSISQLLPEINIIRRSFSQLLESVTLRENQRLFVDNHEVAVVYYRYGYDPFHYVTDEMWTLRYKIEISRAIKCPSINYHLAGVKKVQQTLADKVLLERFIDNKAATLMHSTFAGLWGFEMNEQGDEAVQLAFSEPSRFVMKPQREGGGNNIYGVDIVGALTPIRNSKQREAYILMEMINPLPIKNIILGPNISIDQNQPYCEIISELGIYGAICGNRDEVFFNEESGHVLRSKKLGINEGGIAAGYGAIDSPYLI